MPPTHVPYGSSVAEPATLSASITGTTRWVGVLVALVALGGLVIGGIFTFASFNDDFAEITDTFTEGLDDFDIPDVTPPEADVLSESGFTELLGALEERTGSTLVFDATLYPEYASFVVPEDETTKRSRRLYWNGELSDSDMLSTSTQERIDLAELKPQVFLRLLRRVKAMVDNPTSFYLIVRGKSTLFPDDDGARVLAYATNAYSEGAYIAADFSGKVVRKVRF